MVGGALVEVNVESRRTRPVDDDPEEAFRTICESMNVLLLISISLEEPEDGVISTLVSVKVECFIAWYVVYDSALRSSLETSVNVPWKKSGRAAVELVQS